MRPLPHVRSNSRIDIRGKRILLTGASSGIGAVAAQKLAAHGASVIAICSVIVFTALIDWIVWHHRPTVVAYLGMALVISGGLVAVLARRPQPPAVA